MSAPGARAVTVALTQGSTVAFACLLRGGRVARGSEEFDEARWMALGVLGRAEIRAFVAMLNASRVLIPIRPPSSPHLEVNHSSFEAPSSWFVDRYKYRPLDGTLQPTQTLLRFEQ